MENFKNPEFVWSLIAACCLTLFFLDFFEVVDFRPAVAYGFFSVTFIIFRFTASNQSSNSIGNGAGKAMESLPLACLAEPPDSAGNYRADLVRAGRETAIPRLNTRIFAPLRLRVKKMTAGNKPRKWRLLLHREPPRAPAAPAACNLP